MGARQFGILPFKLLETILKIQPVSKFFDVPLYLTVVTDVFSGYIHLYIQNVQKRSISFVFRHKF